MASDAAYIASVASQIDGPVLLAAHSYAGTVITVAGAAANGDERRPSATAEAAK